MCAHTLIETALPALDLRSAAWHTVQTFGLAVEVEVAVETSVIATLRVGGLSTHSMQRHGKLGIQYSVLSLEASILFEIRVIRVCSISGRLITFSL